MSFDLTAIFVLAITAVFYLTLLPKNWRQPFLLAGSVVALYWLQPPLPPRFADFLLPTATLLLIILTWLYTLPKTQPPHHPIIQPTQSPNRQTLLLLLLLLLLLNLNRFLPFDWRITAGRPPNPLWVALGTTAVLLPAFFLPQEQKRWGKSAVLLLILACFFLLKIEPLGTAGAALWRTATSQDVTLASPLDLRWLGYSYIAFRLLHVLRDHQLGTLPALSLREFSTYVLFAPALIAGPIDRVERFTADFRALPQLPAWQADRLSLASWRILLGMVKKFALADTLALGLSLSATTAEQATSSLGLWLLTYGYAFRLYLDFSGYTDIAIGLGLLFGITLPENFRAPYLAVNLTSFWQRWHITLSDWVRFYVFSPLSRNMLRRRSKLLRAAKTENGRSPLTYLQTQSGFIVLVAQLTTMLIIGLWHGVTWNFFIWGAWHGLGLFVHKQWSDRTRKWQRSLADKPLQRKVAALAGWLLTFHYVVIGWVWFVLPTTPLAWQTIGRLFGLGW